MREKITFQPGRPELVKLDFGPDGIEREGRTGPQYMYTCDDDRRIMFVDPPVRELILETGAQEGDSVRITKGARKGNWRVDRIETEPAQPMQRAAAPPAIDRAAAPRPAAQPEAAARLITAEAADMTAAFVAAIEATGAAEAYAPTAGVRDLALTRADTITRVALAIYIGRRQAGSR